MAKNKMFGRKHDAETNSARWYAVKCQPNREAVAARHLANQGITTFLPRSQKVRRHARKVDVVLAPFFPTYLFVRLDLTRDRWRNVNGTVGVSSIVMQGDAPAPLPHGVIETLQGRCDGDGVFDALRGIQPGESVRILSGVLTDFVGRLESLDAEGRVKVLLNILGKPTSIVLPLASVVPESLSA